MVALCEDCLAAFWSAFPVWEAMIDDGLCAALSQEPERENTAAVEGPSQAQVQEHRQLQ